MSTRAVQAERTRQQILDTAHRMFAELGYEATSLQMIADEMGLTKAAVYYHFRTKNEILHAAMQPGIDRLDALLDEAAAIRGRRVRTEYLVTGFVDFLVENRLYAAMAVSDHHRLNAAMAASDIEAKRAKTMPLRERGQRLLFGDNPTGAQRLAASTLFYIPECLPDLADLSDEELREALRTMVLHMLRLPSGPREQSAPAGA
jgi:AcrR family transcriptional regulator